MKIRWTQLGDTGNWIPQAFINGVWVELRETGRDGSAVSRIELPIK